MTLEEARAIVAKAREDDTLYIRRQVDEDGGHVTQYLDGSFTADQLEALAIVLRAHRS